MAPVTAIAPPRDAAWLRWPLPALAAWSAGWATFAALAASGSGTAAAAAAGAVVGALPALSAATPWRRVFVAAGFPLSLFGSGLAAGLPAWLWLLPLALLALAYPVHAWRDAPMFPTPRHALDGLARLATGLPPHPRLLDAGCGLGHGLQALGAAFPDGRLEGIEGSWPLRVAAALRCPGARIRQGDMWRASWSGYDLVYLFQRPESMARAAAKAAAEMAPGSWLVSLEFEIPGRTPDAVLRNTDARPAWIYRIQGTVAAQDALKLDASLPTTRLLA